MYELIFLKILLQISIFLLQTVPKCHTSIQYTVKNLVKMIFKSPSPKSYFNCNNEVFLNTVLAKNSFFKIEILRFTRFPDRPYTLIDS